MTLHRTSLPSRITFELAQYHGTVLSELGISPSRISKRSNRLIRSVKNKGRRRSRQTWTASKLCFSVRKESAACWIRQRSVEMSSNTSWCLPLICSQASISISFHADIANGFQHVDAPSLAETLLTHPEPYKPFVPLLSQSSNPEDPIPLLASAFLVGLLSRALNATSKPTTETESALSKLYSYLSTLANSSDSGLQDIAVQQYSAVLKIRRSREIFWEQRQETVDPLIEILRSAAGVSSNGECSSTLWSGAASIRAGSELGLGGGVALQLLYHVLLVIWQLSFEGGLVGAGLEEYDAAPSPFLKPAC